MRADYAQIFRNRASVDRYADVIYAPGSYSSHVNARQRAFLRRLVYASFRERRPVQHDFACGTGRAIRLLHGLVREAHGYDPSPAMLEGAREAAVRASLHEIRESGPMPRPATTAGPALVTVFRLLLNAPDPVRERAVGFAAGVLRESGGGLLVAENHGNRHSLRHLSARRRAGDPWFSELDHGRVRELFARHGLRLVTARAFALCPPGAYRRRWLRPLAVAVDDLTARLPWLWRWGTDVLYVARLDGRE